MTALAIRKMFESLMPALELLIFQQRRSFLPSVSSNSAIGPQEGVFHMNTTAILAAWPDDERDRKRAPARY